jgi:hypothetical protein
MDDFEKRVRDRAHKLWEEEGCPEGRADAHWDLARELVAIEDNLDLTLKPVESTELGPYGEPVEPLAPAQSNGETPTMVDQGEEQTIPSPRSQQFADEK